MSSPDASFQYYNYQPTLAPAILFIVLFALATCHHLYQMLRSRTWFMIPFILGAAFETIGYIGRSISCTQPDHQWTLGPFVTQSVLLLVSPALFAASIYMELGRIVLMVHGEKLLFIRRTWMTKIFVSGDVISFLAQSAGASLLAVATDQAGFKMGNDVIIAGLWVQLVFFVIFVVTGSVFHRRLTREPTRLANERPWRKHMMSLYVVSGLIFLRSLVRVIEYQEGFRGYILSHEAFLYVFDATAMFFAAITMNIVHPGEVAAYVRHDKAEAVGSELELASGSGVELPK